jgi:hypothetical protein
VAIYAEGKEHPMAIGYTKMSTEEVSGLLYYLPFCQPSFFWFCRPHRLQVK